MHSTTEALQILARQLGEESLSSRAELEAKMAPLLCLVLRTGQGHPSLLQWVRFALPAVALTLRIGGGVVPECPTLHLARLLCAQLLQDVRVHGDTIVNRQTVVAY